MTFLRKALLALSIVLILVGMGLTFGGVFSPAWQVVDIREFRAEHQHGLWWDCIRAEKHVVAVGDFYDETPLHCMYKFDNSAEMVIENVMQHIDEDGAAGESEHHRFWGWHKAVLTFFVLSICLAFTALCTGCCAPCFAPCTFVYTIALFLSMVCSVLVDGIFFFSANRVDIRFVQGMVGTYEQRIGYAFYLHLLGTGALIGAFVCALLTTYKFFQSSGNRKLFEPQYSQRAVPHTVLGWQSRDNKNDIPLKSTSATKREHLVHTFTAPTSV
uniref:Clc-like protein n=1 Tax=Panagrolaimus sp. ES5 TaxID=591445 RepID=A0AC34F974_9BILA